MLIIRNIILFLYCSLKYQNRIIKLPLATDSGNVEHRYYLCTRCTLEQNGKGCLVSLTLVSRGKTLTVPAVTRLSVVNMSVEKKKSNP